MRITDITCYPVWGGFRNFLFVVVDTDEGIFGVGEAGITGRELAVIGTIEHFKPLLIGQDPFRTEHLWQPCSAAASSQRISRRRSRRSISRCGISRARRWACRSTSCWAVGCATRSSPTRTTAARSQHRRAGRVVSADQRSRLEVRALGFATGGRCARAAPGGAGGHRAIPGRARGGRRRNRADLRCPHPARSARFGLAVPGGRAVSAVLHRGSAACREHAALRSSVPAHVCRWPPASSSARNGSFAS